MQRISNELHSMKGDLEAHAIRGADSPMISKASEPGASWSFSFAGANTPTGGGWGGGGCHVRKSRRTAIITREEKTRDANPRAHQIACGSQWARGRQWARGFWAAT